MKLSFHGAVRDRSDYQVTGSCYQIESKGRQILVDCGLYQGEKTRALNHGSLGFNPSEIDKVVLTHAHCDHTGRLPLLPKKGFKGDIVTLKPTKDLAMLIANDSAHIQGLDEKHDRDIALYNQDDVQALNAYYRSFVEYNEPTEILDGIKVTFFPNGHILGSASVLFEIQEGPSTKKILFSGDIGHKNQSIVGDPMPLNIDADYVVMETTYGDRKHSPIEESIKELYTIIKNTFEKEGNVYIPVFAVQRAQQILHFLKRGVEEGLLPMNTRVILDSPMAISATEIFKKYPEYLHGFAKKILLNGQDPFAVENFRAIRESKDSMTIGMEECNGGAVILAGSGMCNGGRIVHHLAGNLKNPEDSFVFLNYASPHTLPRRLMEMDRSKPIRVNGTLTYVNASLYRLKGFSAHADKDGLMEWHGRIRKPRVTFLTHGDEDPVAAAEKKLKDKNHEVVIPQLHQSFKL